MDHDFWHERWRQGSIGFVFGKAQPGQGSEMHLGVAPQCRQSPTGEPRDQGADFCSARPHQNRHPKPECQNSGRKARIPVNLKQVVARLHIVRSVHRQAGHKLGHGGEGQTCVQKAGCAIVPGCKVCVLNMTWHDEVFQWGRPKGMGAMITARSPKPRQPFRKLNNL